MKRLIIGLTLLLSACAVPQDTNAVRSEPVISEPVMEMPSAIGRAPTACEVASDDGIGGTGCR